jgi:hypothetical protein
LGTLASPGGSAFGHSCFFGLGIPPFLDTELTLLHSSPPFLDPPRPPSRKHGNVTHVGDGRTMGGNGGGAKLVPTAQMAKVTSICISHDHTFVDYKGLLFCKAQFQGAYTHCRGHSTRWSSVLTPYIDYCCMTGSDKTNALPTSCGENSVIPTNQQDNSLFEYTAFFLLSTICLSLLIC